MLSTSNPDNACWSEEDGTKIIVKDKKRFEQEDMKQYFTINKFASFSRQLNLYGFKKKSTGSCCDGQEVFFHNPLFMRDRIDLLNQIKRSSSKSTNATSQPTQEEELQTMQEQKINILEEKVARLEAQLSNIFNGQNIPAHSRPNSINSLLDIIDTTTMPALTKTKNMKRANSSVSSQFDLLIDGSQDMDEFFDSKFDMSTTDLGRPTTYESKISAISFDADETIETSYAQSPLLHNSTKNERLKSYT